MGKRLKALLRAKGMTQKQLAERLGLSAPTVAKYISGLSAPSRDVAAKMARLLDADADDLGAREQKMRGPQVAGRISVAALDAALARLSITDTELARRAGCHRQAIYAYRLGKHSPSASTLRDLARALEMAPADLLAPEPAPRAKRATAKGRR